VLESALKCGVVVKRGSWLSFDGEQIGQGQDASRLQMEKDAKLTERIIEKVHEKMKTGTGVALQGGGEGSSES